MNTSTQTNANKKTLGFQTEVKQLLHLMAHALYSNREVFLRELISNASDACDKLKFEALGNDALYAGDSELRITLACDKEARTITVRDNGIGMSEAEVIQHIGTIAHSGTRAFLERLASKPQEGGPQSQNLIGQFGVGFYSAFVVADRVSLRTRRAGADSVTVWESQGAGEYTIEADAARVSVNDSADLGPLTHGTEVVLHLKTDADEFLDDWRLKELVRAYSNHIAFPIRMKKGNSYGENGEVVISEDLETLNQAGALWARAKNEISEQEYKDFYKQNCHDWNDPLAWSHSRVEGTQEYTALLYLPRRAPLDLFEPERRHGVKLFVRRVFILEDSEKLLPNYLRFVRGIIDSNDLPLNVSREMLQGSRELDVIRAACVKKMLGLLDELKKDRPADYTDFWNACGRVLKEGVGEDSGNRERIAALCRFASTHAEAETQNVTLDDYIARMQSAQEKIYYVTAESHAAAQHSPHLEIFRKKGIEVLLLSERIDEWFVSHLHTYKDKPLTSISKGELDLGTLDDAAAKQQQETRSEEYQPLLKAVEKSLAGRIKQARITHRLTESPACLVAEAGGMGAHLERMLQAAGHPVSAAQPTLELNPDHALVQQLRATFTREALVQDLAAGVAQTGGTPGEGIAFDDWAVLLFEQALLAEGGSLPDPAAFVQRMNRMMLARG